MIRDGGSRVLRRSAPGRKLLSASLEIPGNKCGAGRGPWGGGVGRGEVGVVRGVNGPESFGERER